MLVERFRDKKGRKRVADLQLQISLLYEVEHFLPGLEYLEVGVAVEGAVLHLEGGWSEVNKESVTEERKRRKSYPC